MTPDEQRIVDWLRRETEHNAKVDVGGSSETSAHTFAVACRILAEAIERGEHRKP